LNVAVRREIRRSSADRTTDPKSSAKETTRKVGVARWAWEWTKSIVIAFSLFLLIRTFLVEAFRIPTGSMENTLLVGDFLLVNKAVYGAQLPMTRSHLPAFDEPKRGHVVVFVPPHEPDKNYVKRLIGVGGDTLEMRSKILYLNGKPLDESPYVRWTDSANDVYAPSMYWQCDYVPREKAGGECRPTRDNWGPIVVPQGKYMMLGDNRDDSEDSRYWGFVERNAIKGKPLFIYYSFDSSTLRPFPWLTHIRWARIGGGIH
jgi:signal peptidase I